MTKLEARIILLEEAVLQAQSTVRFLHDCLTDPEHNKYMYPEQTEKHLNNWMHLVEPHHLCPHSVRKMDCGCCDTREKLHAQREQAKKVLKENG